MIIIYVSPSQKSNIDLVLLRELYWHYIVLFISSHLIAILSWKILITVSAIEFSSMYPMQRIFMIKNMKKSLTLEYSFLCCIFKLQNI